MNRIGSAAALACLAAVVAGCGTATKAHLVIAPVLQAFGAESFALSVQLDSRTLTEQKIAQMTRPRKNGVGAMRRLLVAQRKTLELLRANSRTHPAAFLAANVSAPGGDSWDLAVIVFATNSDATRSEVNERAALKTGTKKMDQFMKSHDNGDDTSGPVTSTSSTVSVVRSENVVVIYPGFIAGVTDRVMAALARLRKS